MVSINKKLQLVEDITSCVRELTNALDMDDCDLWDEKEGGVGWLDNEIGVAVELLQKIWPNFVYPNWSHCRTVSQFQEVMMTLPTVDLIFIYMFVKRGGTSENMDLREKKKEYVIAWHKGYCMAPAFDAMKHSSLSDKEKEATLKWFGTRGWISLEHVCAVCHMEGKLKKCSSCLTTRYCSSECQKKDWTTHKKSCNKL